MTKLKVVVCDAKLMSNIFCGCGWKDRSNPNSWWHKTPRYKRVVHHEFTGFESSMFVVHFGVLVCFVCLYVYGVWNLQFNGSVLLSLLWWWSRFVVAIELALNEECGSHSSWLIGVGDGKEINKSWQWTIKKGVGAF